jgi:peptidoglycan/xylan/chitin deacetylase (PgdA/CDA1 family)
MKKSRSTLALIALAALSVPGLTGCHRGGATATHQVSVTPASAKAKPSKPAPLTPEQLKQARPNEGGLVPILEYHHVEKCSPQQMKSGMFRLPDEFRKDLQRVYAEGYRPVSLSSYLDNRIDVPYGKSPVILTFDDALPSQFTYLPDGSIDPDCAVGILQAFNKEHPDFALRGTFFVLPTAPGFGPRDQTAKKLQALLQMGFEIGNHTMTHPRLSHKSDEQVQEEIATCASTVMKMAPGAHVDTLALPYGIAPHNRALAAAGEYNGFKYKNRAVLLVGAEPARAPISKRFNPLRIPRIQAAVGPSRIGFWLDRLKADGSHYVSDGDPNVTTIPKGLESKIDPKRLNGAQLRTYGD